MSRTLNDTQLIERSITEVICDLVQQPFVLLGAAAAPQYVTSIGKNAFESCYGLSSIVVDKRNPVYDSRDNCNAIIATATNEIIVRCRNTTTPNGCH